jgi:RNAse (barnase) inhibitor barstar
MPTSLRVYGDQFAVDEVLSTCPIKPVAITRKGSPNFSQSKRLCENSGFNICISEEDFTDITKQIDDTRNFLVRHKGWLSVLRTRTDIDYLAVDFGLSMERGHAMLDIAFPPDFTVLVGSLGIDLEITFYPSPGVSKPIYIIDGRRFSTLDEFYDEVSTVLIPGAEWGRNLDAFNDILKGGFGTPDDGFVIHWKFSAESQQKLGYEEAIRCLTFRLRNCDPSSRATVEQQLVAAKMNTGPTVYDWLIDIIRMHGVGGTDEIDGIELVLD